jgi:hypothetical protein
MPSGQKPHQDLASRLQKRAAQGILSMDMDARLLGLRKLWMFGIGLCVAALLASFGVKSYSLNMPGEKGSVPNGSLSESESV